MKNSLERKGMKMYVKILNHSNSTLYFVTLHSKTLLGYLCKRGGWTTYYSDAASFKNYRDAFNRAINEAAKEIKLAVK